MVEEVTIEPSTSDQNNPPELSKASNPGSPQATLEMDVQENSKSPDLTGLLTWLRNDPPLSSERLSDLCIEHSDFEAALRVIQPSAKREGFATVPDVTWDDIGALEDIREELQMAIVVSGYHYSYHLIIKWNVHGKDLKESKHFSLFLLPFILLWISF